MPSTTMIVWAIGIGIILGDASAYPTASRYPCTDSRTIGISSSSTFMVRLVIALAHYTNHQNEDSLPLMT